MRCVLLKRSVHRRTQNDTFFNLFRLSKQAEMRRSSILKWQKRSLAQFMKPQRLLLSLGSILAVYMALEIGSLTQVPAQLNQPRRWPSTPTKSSPLVSQQAPQDQIYRSVNPTVVTVYCGQEIGSGSLVSRDGWVLTNKHVVEESVEVEVKTADGKTYVGEVRAINLRYDLALVQLNTQDQFPIVRLANAVTVQTGDPIYALGSPGGRSGTLTTGTFRRITSHGSLQTSPGLLQVGNSGGPLLNQQGELIGVNKGVLDDNSGLATSVVAVREFINRHRSRMRSSQE